MRVIIEVMEMMTVVVRVEMSIRAILDLAAKLVTSVFISSDHCLALFVILLHCCGWDLTFALGHVFIWFYPILPKLTSYLTNSSHICHFGNDRKTSAPWKLLHQRIGFWLGGSGTQSLNLYWHTFCDTGRQGVMTHGLFDCNLCFDNCLQICMLTIFP